MKDSLFCKLYKLIFLTLFLMGLAVIIQAWWELLFK